MHKDILTCRADSIIKRLAGMLLRNQLQRDHETKSGDDEDLKVKLNVTAGAPNSPCAPSLHITPETSEIDIIQAVRLVFSRLAVVSVPLRLKLHKSCQPFASRPFRCNHEKACCQCECDHSNAKADSCTCAIEVPAVGKGHDGVHLQQPRQGQRHSGRSSTTQPDTASGTRAGPRRRGSGSLQDAGVQGGSTQSARQNPCAT